MNYRHIYHAGNFADVFKHVLLINLIELLQRKDNGFCFVDTHAAAGLYDLHSQAAQINKEFALGISKVLSQNNLPDILKKYETCIKSFNPHKTATLKYYPGSPLIADYFLRQQDRMVLAELESDTFKSLKRNLESSHHNIQIFNQDAYQTLKANLPPKERRGLILIDPPYEKPDEFNQVIEAINNGLKRFENGVYAIWYPIKDKSPLSLLQNKISFKNNPVLVSEFCIYPANLAAVLNGCGMMVINPPFQFEENLKDYLPKLWQILSIEKNGYFSIKKFDLG